MDSIELLRLMHQSIVQNGAKMKQLLFNQSATMTLDLNEETTKLSEKEALFEERLAHIKKLNTP